MDKKITRETRIDDQPQSLEHMAQENEMLFDEATSLAYRTFQDATTDGHIACVFERLRWNMLGGLGEAGAVTIH